MKEDNLEASPLGGEQKGIEQQNKISNRMKIVGINLLVLAAYTVFCKLQTEDIVGAIFDAFLIGFHVLICIIVSVAGKRWVWLLSGGLVLVIGFSTCISIGKL